ncbi:MAG: hypothetical protein JSW71_22060 [Gemmatimonadota bacterium]|nr:MAG: hypothetical protein JSW71_22060 [Gemmatimonadota bacterium]
MSPSLRDLLPPPLKSAARRVVRRSRRAWYRLLHPVRRHLALKGLGAIGFPKSVLFVCHGNINRSAYAAGAFLRDLPAAFRDHVHVDSAGFIGPDRQSPPHAISAAGERGVDLSGHRSKMLTRDLVRAAELVVVMDPYQRAAVLRMGLRNGREVVVLGDLLPEAAERRGIADPYDGELPQYEYSFDQVDAGLQQLVGAITLDPQSAHK